MKKILLLTLTLALTGLVSNASAGTIKLPKEDPAVSITVPDSWKPEDTDQGFACESEDQAATIIFEVSPAKKIDSLIDENVDWLVKDQKVVIDKSSEKKSELEAGGIKWSLLTWDGKNDEYGPATITLAFGDIGKNQILMITYWVTKKGEKIHAAELNKILDSIKKVTK
ncbi:MAG: hypothetical protein ABIP97_10190 [Chthoniobacterales bacterium]